MESYLSGQATADSVWELLVDGRAVIYGTDLREQAYQVIRQTWPRSVPLLDVSRIAAEIQADLGLIAPLVHTVGADLRVDFHLNMVDSDDPHFLDRLRAYDGPRGISRPTQTWSCQVCWPKDSCYPARGRVGQRRQLTTEPWRARLAGLARSAATAGGLPGHRIGAIGSGAAEP
jgi:hypothetical protein